MNRLYSFILSILFLLLLPFYSLSASLNQGLITFPDVGATPGFFPGTFVYWNITTQAGPYPYHYLYITSVPGTAPGETIVPAAFLVQTDISNTNTSFANFNSIAGALGTAYPSFPTNANNNGVYGLAWSLFLPPVVPDLSAYLGPAGAGQAGVVYSFDSVSAPMFGSFDYAFNVVTNSSFDILWMWNNGLDGTGSAFIGVPGAAPSVATVPEPSLYLVLGSTLLAAMGLRKTRTYRTDRTYRTF